MQGTNQMKVAFCSYRRWAYPVLETVTKHPRVSSVVHITDNRQLYMQLGLAEPDFFQSKIALADGITLTGGLISGTQKDIVRPKLVDLVLFCGWSTPPTEEMVNAGVPMVSEHPAASDRYSPGTPLQNQILDGITRTKHRIVKVGYPELAPRQWSHEVDMDLSGNMSDILTQMQATSQVLFTRFLDEYPNVSWQTWDEVPEAEQVPRRTPSMSRITKEEVNKLTTKELYDRLRCLEDPYPNGYLEDDHGILYVERVRFKAK